MAEQETAASERSRGQKVAAFSGTVALFVVVAAPVLASWHGLTATARDWFGLHGWWAYLPPLVADGAALYAAVLALQDTLAGDSARGNRALVWLYAALSAGLNIMHADAVGGIARAIFYGAASISAVILFDRTLRQIRRRELRVRGFVDAPAPRFRALRWLLHTRQTWRAWRLAIGRGISRPDEALSALTEYERADVDAALAVIEAEHVVREAYQAMTRVARSATETTRTLVDAERCAAEIDRAMTGDHTAQLTALPRGSSSTKRRTKSSGTRRSTRPDLEVADVPLPAELEGLTEDECVRWAFEQLGEINVKAARRFLAERGKHTDRSGAYATARAVRAEQEHTTEREQVA